jgi:Transposase DNA-binding/Transposase DDE domain
MNRREGREGAYEDFGDAELGDARRTQRVVSMAATANARPAGRVLQVFQSSAERQGAYDLLGSSACKAERLTEALGRSSARRSTEHRLVFVSTDGSSLSLADRGGKKGFGRIGSTKSGGRGLKVITSYAIDPAGVPIGVLDQQWWSRSSGRKRHDCHARSLEDKETRHWLHSLESSKALLGQHAPNTRVWFLLDRENDRCHCLTWLRDSGATYVVRSSYNRRLDGADPRYLVDELDTVAPMHEYSLQVTAGPGRTARLARMVVRASRVLLRLRDRRRETHEPFETTVVEAREEGTTPVGENPITWRLLTNHDVQSSADADEVIEAYAKRWRIEEFHKTWKTGACNVEDSQLRDKAAMVKWATIMAAAAARIERLKVLSRTQPELPASHELTPYEISALIKLKRMHKKRTETIADAEPTLAQAVLWLAELGGYTGKSSGGPPGSITIRRGLDYITPAAALLEALQNEGKLR